MNTATPHQWHALRAFTPRPVKWQSVPAIYFLHSLAA